MAKRVKYEDLPILPTVAADYVCSQPYTGKEWSEHDPLPWEKTEEKRKKMSPDEIREFGDLCDARCKAAYEAKAEWFEKIVKAKRNKGRDQLYVWLTHWMASYLTNPERFRRQYKDSMRYQIVYNSRAIAGGDAGQIVIDRILMVDADDVGHAIDALKEQMKRESEKITKIIAVAPAFMIKG